MHKKQYYIANLSQGNDPSKIQKGTLIFESRFEALYFITSLPINSSFALFSGLFEADELSGLMNNPADLTVRCLLVDKDFEIATIVTDRLFADLQMFQEYGIL